MRRRIYLQLIAVAGTAILATLLLVTAVYYEVFEQQVFGDLALCARLLSGAEGEEITKLTENNDLWLEKEKESKKLRITLIDKEGRVLFDTAAKGEINNHSDRAEIIEAFARGEGRIVRNSPTFHKNTFYFALRINENTVLRVAKEADSIFGVFKGVLPLVLFLSLLLFMLCMALAQILTRRFVAPVERLAKEPELAGDMDTYRELRPFIKTIREQHESILQNARMRQEFTANVSHELKTPLAAIQGYAELIENGMASGEDAARFAKKIGGSSKRLLALINDILRLSELDVQKGGQDCEALDLSALAKTCVEMLQLNAEKQGVGILFSGESHRILADRGMMEELLYNLVDNAIRYNRIGGQVFVSVDKTENEVCLAVKDTGIGIAEKHRERIFERFYRVDKSRSKSTGGTGLGLAIVRHIAVCHNARVELISKLGEGTKISVYFPAGKE